MSWTMGPICRIEPGAAAAAADRPTTPIKSAIQCSRGGCQSRPPRFTSTSLGGTGGRGARARQQGPQRGGWRRGGPIQGVVADAAILRRDWVLRLLAGRGHAVVATLAGRADAEVIEGRSGPRDRAVADAAILRRLHVPYRLAGCRHPVVAADAAGRDALVIEARRQPGCRRVAVLAGVVAGDVGRPFALREHAVVAADAVARHTGVGRRRAGRGEGGCRGRAQGGGTRGGGARADQWSSAGYAARRSQERRSYAGCALRRRGDDRPDGAAGRRRRRDGLHRIVATPVVRAVAAAAILADVVIIRPRGQIGDAIKTLARVVTRVAALADHREHQRVLGRRHGR